MWILILIAVHINNPNDQPGRIELVFPNQISCEQSLQSMTYWLKFNQFKINGRCVKNEP
jgi:hypothetical protein